MFAVQTYLSIYGDVCLLHKALFQHILLGEHTDHVFETTKYITEKSLCVF